MGAPPPPIGLGNDALDVTCPDEFSELKLPDSWEVTLLDSFDFDLTIVDADFPTADLGYLVLAE